MAVRLIVLVALGLLVVSTARMEGALRDTLQIEEPEMSKITFTKPLDDGTVATLTVTQHPGESTAAFMARARAEWQAFCAQFGQ